MAQVDVAVRIRRPVVQHVHGRSARAARICLYRPLSFQCASIFGLVVARLAFMPNPVAGRLTVFFTRRLPFSMSKGVRRGETSMVQNGCNGLSNECVP